MKPDKALLGAILSGYRGLPDLPVSADDFEVGYDGDLWQACHAVYEAGGQPDPLTVRAALGVEVEKRLPGGVVYLAELMQDCPSPLQAPEYARQVVEDAGRRRLADAARQIMHLSQSDGDVVDLHEHARATLDAAGSNAWRRPSQTLGAVLPEVLDLVEHGTRPGVATPWGDLDDLITGLRPGSLYVVGARPSFGKSIVGANMACHCALVEGRGAFIASLEMGRHELGQRIVAAEARVSLSSMLGASLSPDDWTAIARKTNQLTDAPILIEDSPSQTTASIRAGVRDAARTHDLGVVVVDYLQLVQPRDTRATREQQVADISRSLKHLAREQDVAVVALAQVNRASMARHDKRPTLADLRESGSIEADADVVMLLHRDDANPHAVEVIVAKNRSGPVGTAHLQMHGHNARLVSAYRPGAPA